MKKFAAIFSVAVLVGCKSTSLDVVHVVEDPFISVYDSAPDMSASLASEYLSGTYPLDDTFVTTPFLFDGDRVLLDKFDMSAWRNKRFINVEGKAYHPDDRFLVDMESGDIRALGDEFEFKSLLKSLLVKVMPLKGLAGTPRYLVLTNMVVDGSDASVLVIEDPLTLKIHGFIESALIDANFSSSLFRTDR